MDAIRALLQGSIDYAGLFPPAGLDMVTAVTNYDKYQRGPAAWALGRFIVPASRLPELEEAVQGSLSPERRREPRRLGVLAGDDLQGDLDRLSEFNRRQAVPGGTQCVADSIEVKAATEPAIEAIMRRKPMDLQAYIEIPIEGDPGNLIAAISRLGARAKVRTGGVTGDAFPATDKLIRFVQSCVRADVPFKATAGLHHPLRAEYRLTYAPDSPRGTMFGFLNLFLATAFLQAGMDLAEARTVLEEQSAGSIQADDHGIGWTGHRLDLEAIVTARHTGMISFGSCSFTEPIGDLETLGLLAPRAQRA